MSLQWWKKTVEFQFVLAMAREKKIFLAPLDGRQERAGDAIFSSNNRWVLIEFKKNAASISTEKKKFINYQEARTALSGWDGHHHLVYGLAPPTFTSGLLLRSQTYFPGVGCDLPGILKSGVEFRVFKRYIKQYTEFKKGPDDGSGTGGLLTMDDLALVASVTTENKIVGCLSLTEFQQQLRQLGLAHEQEHKIERSKGFSF